MKATAVLAVVYLLSSFTFSRAQTIANSGAAELLIGRQTYFDFGPPFDYYEVIQIRSEGSKSLVRRMLLTPEAGCFQPAKAELQSGSIGESVEQLLAGLDPCAITPRQIKKELKRRKKGLVFSGMNLSMQFQCKQGPRVISSAVLDRDLFSGRPDTPMVTSWSRRILSKVDDVLGNRVMDKPMFLDKDAQGSGEKATDSDFARDVAEGIFDTLFPGTTDHVSAIYQSSKKAVPVPDITLIKIDPLNPDSFIAPRYPPIAKAARVEGEVSFRAKIGAACAPDDVAITAGPKMLRQAVTDAVKQWRFCKVDAGQQVIGTIAFRLNCPAKIDPTVRQR